MRKLALLLGLLAAPLAVAGTASAEQPQTTTIPISFAFVDTSSCGPSLPIATSGTGELQITTFADGRQIRHLDSDVTLSANGKTVTSNQTGNVFVDSGGRTIVGTAATITVPGEGLLVLDVGKLVLDPSGAVLFEAAPHELFSHDLAALCAYFANA